MIDVKEIFNAGQHSSLCGRKMPVQRSPHGQCRCNLHAIEEQDKQYRQELKVFLALLTHEQRRLYAAIESNHIGRGGVSRVAKLTGLCLQTIARGRRQMADLLQGKIAKKERKPIKGRPRTEEKYPAIAAALEKILDDEVAGSPEGEQKWIRSSTRNLSRRLKEQGFSVGYKAIWGMLRRMKFSMRTAIRRRRGVTRDASRRDEQFRYIASQRKAFCEAGLPVISVDTKKKELIGNFRNHGRSWCRQAPEVDEHGFPSMAECVATPFGVYDIVRNKGYVVVGVSHNTPEFAVSVIARWWQQEGQASNPGKNHLLILADGGGANGSRSAAWKLNLQEKLCDPFWLKVTVCHYPPGCSKWNPVERRLFSEISKNWEGRPLKGLRLMLAYIRGTTTITGLTVKAYLDEGIYKKGQKVTRDDVKKLNLAQHSVCSDRNYTISPRNGNS